MIDEQQKTYRGEIKKIVVTVIITGLFSAVIFTPAGYVVNQYITKDNIKIEKVDFLPETKE